MVNVKHGFLVFRVPHTWSSVTENKSSPLLTHPQADQDSYSAPVCIGRLWVHECERVFRDRIISSGEMEAMDAMMAETAKKYLTELQVNSRRTQSTEVPRVWNKTLDVDRAKSGALLFILQI